MTEWILIAMVFILMLVCIKMFRMLGKAWEHNKKLNKANERLIKSIEKLRAENERLQKRIEQECNISLTMAEKADSLKADNERLQRYLDQDS